MISRYDNTLAEQQAPNTGHAEADRLIGRLMSSDPDFEDCRQAAELIQREIKGPDGFGTWREAAIAERLARVNQQAAPKAAPGEPVAWRISDPNEPDLGFWLAEEDGGEGFLSEPLYTRTAPQAAGQDARPCHVFTVRKAGGLTEWEPTTMALALPDGAHALYTLPQPSPHAQADSVTAPAVASEPIAYLYDDGSWTPAKTEEGHKLNDWMISAGSPKIGVHLASTAQPTPLTTLAQATQVGNQQEAREPSHRETVDVVGVRSNGEHVNLEKIAMPPRMKAREIAIEQFGSFKDDDGSDAEMCFGALEYFLEWLIQQGWSKAPQPAPAPLSDDVLRDAAFEAVRKKLCALPRFSFLSDGYGVRRVPDKSGSWIAFDAAHELFDPVSVDAACKQGENT